jgi:hypothetical protein
MTLNDTRKQRVARARARTQRIARAAELLWEDRLTDAQIAVELGIHRATLARLKQDPEVQALLAAHAEEADWAWRKFMHATVWKDSCHLHREYWGLDCAGEIRRVRSEVRDKVRLATRENLSSDDDDGGREQGDQGGGV